MEKLNTEFYLSALIVVLTIIAIAVYIVYHAGALFYGIFLVTAAVTLYTWYRIGHAGRAPSTRRAKKSRRR